MGRGKDQGDDEKVHQKRAGNHLLSDGWISRERDFEVFVTVSRSSPDSLPFSVERGRSAFSSKSSCTPFFCAIVLQACSSASLGQENMNACKGRERDVEIFLKFPNSILYYKNCFSGP